MSHISSRIICPKCQTQTMRKSVSKTGPEYYDDKCHSYFTIEELVNEWNYDLGDFGDVGTFKEKIMLEVFAKGFLETQKYLRGREIILDVEKWEEFIYPDTASPTFEPVWKSPSERNSDYEEVTLMQLGIPAWATEDNSVDHGDVPSVQ